MNSSSSIPVSFLIQQIAFVLPTIIVCVVGAVLALVNLKRYRLPAGLTLASCLLLILVSLAFPVVQSLAIASGNQPGGDFERTRMLMQITGVVSTLLRTIALGLLLGAVFSGRRAAA